MKEVVNDQCGLVIPARHVPLFNTGSKYLFLLVCLYSTDKRSGQGVKFRILGRTNGLVPVSGPRHRNVHVRSIDSANKSIA
jgi:hypothetical protein